MVREAGLKGHLKEGERQMVGGEMPEFRHWMAGSQWRGEDGSGPVPLEGPAAARPFLQAHMETTIWLNYQIL